MISTITKRDGRVVPFEKDKIEEAIARLDLYHPQTMIATAASVLIGAAVLAVGVVGRRLAT